MAQSKKNVLKRINRQCVRLNSHVKYVVAQRRNYDIDDEFGLIWGSAYEMLREIQRMHLGKLERSRYELSPVTYQQASLLYERLQMFSQQVLSSR